MKVKLSAGNGEVVLKNLSKSLDKDSVRVDGLGPASITEVSFQVRIIAWDQCPLVNFWIGEYFQWGTL